ncbi:hypothetical protein ACRRTK_018457 [Alexandromys fortis]
MGVAATLEHLRAARPPRRNLPLPFASVVAATISAAILGAELARPSPAESRRGSDARFSLIPARIPPRPPLPGSRRALAGRWLLWSRDAGRAANRDLAWTGPARWDPRVLAPLGRACQPGCSLWMVSKEAYRIPGMVGVWHRVNLEPVLLAWDLRYLLQGIPVIPELTV